MNKIVQNSERIRQVEEWKITGAKTPPRLILQHKSVAEQAI